MSKRWLGLLLLLGVWIGASGVAHAAVEITVDPTGPLDFSHVDVGTTGPTMLRITATSTGTSPLMISSAGVLTPHGPDYAVTGVAGAQTVGAGNSVHWDIQCRPQTRGVVDGTFQIVSNAPTSPSNVTLKCTGDQGVLAIDTTTFDFQATLVGSTKTKNVVLSNPGNVAVSGITGVLDNLAIGYSIDPNNPVPDTLNPGDTDVLTIKFAPTKNTDGGAASLAFNGTWHSHATSPVATALAGLPVNLNLSTLAIDFGTFRFDTAPAKSFQIINAGTTAIPIASVNLALGPDPAELPTTIKLNGAIVTLPASLPAGQAFVVTVTARPNNRVGDLSGMFIVHSSLAGLIDQNVGVTGTAIAAGLTATPMLDFNAVDLDLVAATPPKLTATLTNTGTTANLDVSGFTVTNPSGTQGAFTFTSALPSAPSSLAPGNSLTFEVTYKPTVERAATDPPDKIVLSAVVSGVLGGPVTQTIAIQGHGIDRHLAVDAPTFPPTFKNPGDTAPTRAVTVHNNGDALLKITAVTISGGPVWQLVDGAAVDVPGRGSHDFMVKFSPSAIGPAPAGQLTLTSNDNQNPVKVVALDGTAVARDVAFGPAAMPDGPIELGTVGVGARFTVADVLTVTNRDPAAAFTIHAIQLSGDPAFQLVSPPADDMLPASSTKTYAVAFQPPAAGDFRATATLFLDQDPDAQAEVQIVGHAVPLDVYGGGGCATGRATGGGAVLLVLAAWLAGSRRRRRAAVIVFALAALPARVFADDVRVGAFDPTPATAGIGFQVESAEVGDNGAWAATGVVSYATNPMLVAVGSRDGAVEIQHPIARSTMVELGGAYAFLGRFEAGLRMPFYSQRGDVTGGTGAGAMIPAVSGTALGDLALHAKARIVDRATLTAGAAVHVTLPTSSSDQFTGVDLPTLRVLGLATVTPSPRLTLSLDAGAVLRKTSDYRNQIFIEQGSGLVWGAGASVRVADRLFAIAEVFGELVPKARAMTGSVSPIEGLVGASYRFEPGVTVGFAVGRGLSRALGSPELRGTFTMSFTSGTGRLAPIEPEPPRARVAAATAAVQPELDSDHDGIPDAQDRCPLDPEDKDGFQDADGCPDPDNDGDGIPDAQDKCPDQPETINGFQDEDGCPDAGGDTAATVGVAPGQSPKQAAEDTFQRGRALMEQHKYLAACAAFEQSQRLDPAAGTRYNLAGCYAEIGKLATAWTLFRELARSDKNTERRAKSAELAAQLAPRVPKLKMILHGAPAGTNVSLNATNVNALIGIETPVDLGSYTIVAGAPNHRGWRKIVEMKKEAEVITVDIDLGPELTR